MKHKFVQRSKTARGETMLFLTLEDISGVLDVILFPEVYRQARPIITSQAPFLVSGVMEISDDRSEPFLRAERVVELK